MTGSAETMYINFLRRMIRQRLLMHLLFWLAVIVFCFYVFRQNTIARTLRANLGFLPGHMIFVYSLNYFLFPRYVLKGKFFSAFIGLVAIVAISLFYLRFADVYITHYSGNTRMWGRYNYPRAMYALFSVGWIAVSIRLVKKWYFEKEVQHRLEKEKLTVELQLLRSQLHPHFLFNTLNSLYAMTLERSVEAPEAVLQLSSLLRYILYECNDPVVPLCQEIKSLQDYIALEKMRFGDRLEVSLSFTGDLRDRTIAPLLFLPFVENSIKHGIGESPGTNWISLHLHVEGPTFSFKLINSRHPETPASPLPNGRTAIPDSHDGSNGVASGLGLTNVRRRLDLLYPSRYNLLLLPEEDTFLVSLTLTARKYETETEMLVG